MSEHLKRLTVLSVSEEVADRLTALHQQTRMPIALLIEDAINLLWNEFQYDDSDTVDAFHRLWCIGSVAMGGY